MRPLFLIGHPRCGTTSLNVWLAQSASIKPALKKELMFFTKNYHKGIDWYEDNFHDKGNILLDATPYNSFINYAAERIHLHYPTARIVQVIRNPVDRVHSWWKVFYKMRAGREPRTFSEFLKQEMKTYDTERYQFEANYVPFCDHYGGPYNPFILESGAYAKTYKRFSKLFGDINIKVVLFEHLIADPIYHVNSILQFAEADTLPSGTLLNPAQIYDNWAESENRNLVCEEPSKEEIDDINLLYLSEVYDMSKYTGIDLFEEWKK